MLWAVDAVVGANAAASRLLMVTVALQALPSRSRTATLLRLGYAARRRADAGHTLGRGSGTALQWRAPASAWRCGNPLISMARRPSLRAV
jgi:hypothetical protein